MTAWSGGDPGTGRGGRMRGGLPPRRPDQQYRPVGPQGPVGSSSSIVRARRVIVSGTSDGIFVYNGTPAAGNLILSVAAQSGTDSHGNAYFAGFSSYTAAGTSRLGIAGAAMSLITTLTNTLFDPGTTGLRIKANPGPVEIDNVVMLSEQSSAPATPVSAGDIYVDATGHLTYKGPSGTVTVLAPP